MKTSNSTLTRTLLLLGFTAVAMSGCPKQWQPPKEPEFEKGIFVAGTFNRFMTLGKKLVVTADERLTVASRNPQEEPKRPTADDAEMFVGRFGSGGQAEWLRGFGTIAPGTAVAFVADSNQITVVGIVNKSLTIDGNRILPRIGTDGPVRPNGLFIATFGADGRLRMADTVAVSRLFDSPDIRRAGKNIQIVMPVAGTVVVKEKTLEGGDVDAPEGERKLELTVTPDAKVTAAELRPINQMPQPAVKQPSKKLGFQVAPEAKSGWMLASMQLVDRCDYCATNQNPRYDGHARPARAASAQARCSCGAAAPTGMRPACSRVRCPARRRIIASATTRPVRPAR